MYIMVYEKFYKHKTAGVLKGKMVLEKLYFVFCGNNINRVASLRLLFEIEYTSVSPRFEFKL